MDNTTITEKPLIVGVGEFAVSHTKGQVLKTFSLGSCVAVCALAPSVSIAGLLHVQLPDSKIPNSAFPPSAFADTGIQLLFKEMRRQGCEKYSLVKIKIVGGANTLGEQNSIEVGKKNILAVKKTLWQFGLGPLAEDVGGEIPRTVEIVTGFDMVTITNGSNKWYI